MQNFNFKLLPPDIVRTDIVQKIWKVPQDYGCIPVPSGRDLHPDPDPDDLRDYHDYNNHSFPDFDSLRIEF